MEQEFRVLKSVCKRFCSHRSSNPLHLRPPWLSLAIRTPRSRDRQHTTSGIHKRLAKTLPHKPTAPQNDAQGRITHYVLASLKVQPSAKCCFNSFDLGDPVSLLNKCRRRRNFLCTKFVTIEQCQDSICQCLG